MSHPASHVRRPLIALLAIALTVSLSPLAAAHQESEDSDAAQLLDEVRGTLVGSAEPIIEMASDITSSSSFEPAAAARVVTSGRRSSGVVALTFDDGTNVPACRRIARTLRQRNAKGTFFINGNHIKNQPGTWRRVLKGMPVANHTRSHYNLTTQSDRVVTKQIRENEAVHERYLRKPMLKMLRPPYGAYDSRTLRIAGSLGYGRVVLWSVDTFDWKSSSSASEIAARAKGAPPGAVILMHCSRSATADALPSIIRHYKRRGIELAGLRKVLRR